MGLTVFETNKKIHQRLLLFVFISLFIHLSVLFLLKSGLISYEKNISHQEKIVFIPLKKNLPIADIEKPQKEETPSKASAEGLYNQKVEKEMVAPSSGPQKKPSQRASQKTSPQKAPQEKSQTQKQAEALIFKKESPPSIPGMPEQAEKPFRPQGDFLPNYTIGNRTYLNTLANPNIAYFVELKRKFKLTFNPVPALRAHINEISRGKIDVILGVSVNAQGNIADLIVIRTSGIPAYDQEGIRTVRASSPFTSPPSNLLAPDNLLHMAWTFSVYL
ncbi:MAG: hypothetical protein A3G32_07370 [Deltaproteobacteria bacterium RIFCSPLOWO2_12_FULL_40_28]|nr:MAG: hypothetical protein A3C45_07415 [Deltaproteobacteria bacterium RIFCSPHIGHO2_02_FULL_40_28]OGQ19225.1 MAG: hypothetical protein A3E27_04400 [Deltaproteobacteria bacterium RIFCSPHIGHO2_12_FULL_40_32]OGQ40551.1 MAG: hypothetical protein A3I69_00670 [Deltaproteobacteria bacterium RIFCSPLOWO2_02_FULL_40_36]OGQ53786.1 MAG: hypothetical protein A3G32_07370 [Deltaproteobacteria bacterium RIFCSPLOWO2_12_FULL_40_28]